MKFKFAIILFMVVSILLVGGWVWLTRDDSRTEQLSIQAGDRTVELISIQELLGNREKFDERKVAIKGTIVAQCGRGCKFSVDDGTGVLFVQMLGEAWARPLPQSMGKTVEVRGPFFRDPRPYLTVVKVGDAIVR